MSKADTLYKDIFDVLMASNAFDVLRDFQSRGLLKADKNPDALNKCLAYLCYISDHRSQKVINQPDFLPTATRLRGEFNTEVEVGYITESVQKGRELQAALALQEMDEVDAGELN